MAEPESPVVLFGGGWREAGRPHPTWQLMWRRDTGELLLVSEAANAPTDVVAKRVLGRFGSEDEVQAALEGWEEHVGRPDGLSWLRQELGEPA